MKERGWIEPIVERVVGQVLESHAAQLRTEIVRRVMEEMAAQPASGEPASDPSASAGADLARAVAEIQLGSSQREILRALLDTSSRYASRVALFVVKGSHATGWQARGFQNSDAIKDFAFDENAAAISRAVSERLASSAPVSDLDARFFQQFGTPASGQGRVLPLILKDKVAALVYADSGVNGTGLLDAGSLDLLVLSTGAWLEVSSLRKQAQKEPSASHADSPSAPAAASSPATQTATSFNDPFAAHAPAFSSHSKAAAATASAGMAVEVPIASASAAQAPAAEMDPPLAESLPANASTGASALSSEDEEVHRKAQRFARLLVDEIKLYNQAKVAEGRKNKDLYDRLKEAIEKSRSTYQKRYGNTVAASGNYFQHEIIRSLAEDDLSIMGANFRH
jgi:hypothetical protein